MKSLIEGSAKKLVPNVRALASSASTCRILSEPLYPITQTFIFDENLTHESYESQINKLVESNCFSYRGIPSVPPFFPGSVNSFMQIGFETANSQFFGLYSKSKNLPVSILSENRVLVLDKELWGSVSDLYKKDKIVSNIDVCPYDFYEKGFSFDLLKGSVDRIASMDVRNIKLYSSALSRVITMVSYGCFWRVVRQFIQDVLLAKDSYSELGDSVIEMMKAWGKVSKQVHAGKKEFELVDGDKVGIRNLRHQLLLMDSNLKVVEEELEPPVKEWRRSAELGGDYRGRFNMRAVVREVKVVYNRGKTERMSICAIVDESGSAKFRAKNEQVDLVLEGSTLLLLNAKIKWHNYEKFVVIDEFGSIVDDPDEEN